MLISQALAPVALKNGAMKPAFKYLKFSVSYKEFWETSNRFSYFIQKEVGNGKRVGLWMSNCPHIAYCFIALSNTKNCTVPLNPWASPEENLYKIKNAGISVILCSSDHTKKLKEFLQQNGHGAIMVIDMESKRCAEYDTSYTAPPAHAPNEKDHVLLFYTPGTTGKYKGCLFNHNAIVQAMTMVKNAYRTVGNDVFYTQHHYSNPFNYIHYMLAPLLAGATIFISDQQTDYKLVLENFLEYKVTRLSPNLAVFGDLLKFSETEKISMPTVRNISIYGTTLSKETWEHMAKTTKITVTNVYGMTEYLGTIAMTSGEAVSDVNKPNFIGPALLGTKVRVVDDNSDEIDKKKPQKGQLLVMGPAMMDKYLDLPEEQKQTVRGTWLFTGDIVDFDKDGGMTFHDRKADVITLQEGRKIFAKEVEPIARNIPQVEDCAYIAARDRMKKPMPVLVIVKRVQLALNEKQVSEYLTGKVPADKMPAAIFFIDAMPRTVSGAVNRAKLRSQFDGV